MPSLGRRSFALGLAAAVAPGLAGCGPRGGLTFTPGAASPGEVESILVATTRERVEGQPVFTRNRLDEPIFLSFEVSVPPDRAIGSVVFPTDDPPNLRTDFVTLSARQLPGERALVGEINARLAADPRTDGTVGLFVHGYNTTFAEGLYRHAQLLNDYDTHGVPVHFAWPSTASAQGYGTDRESALFSRDALQQTLAAIARSRASKINVIAHSMGAFLTMDALRTMALVGYDEFFAKVNAILLLSPDIEIDVFRKQARPVLERGAEIFVVVSTRDRALLISAVLRGERSRLGSIGSKAEIGDVDVTVIDLSNVEAGGGMGHFALARSPDLIRMLRGMREQGVDVLATERQQGLVASSVALIQEGTEMILSPIAPAAP